MKVLFVALATGDLYKILDDGKNAASYRLRGDRWEPDRDTLADLRKLGKESADYLVVLETEDAGEAQRFMLCHAYESLKNFRVDSKPEHFNSKNIYYEKGDEAAPFVSQGFMYPLLGKEDARSVLGRLNKIENLLKQHLWGKS